MKTTNLAQLCFFLLGCPVAKAHDTPEVPRCVVDLCDKEVCVIDTPDGTVQVKKKPEYKEGAVVECPEHLFDRI